MTIEKQVKKWMEINKDDFDNATFLAESAADHFALNQPDEDIPDWIYEIAIDILPVDQEKQMKVPKEIKRIYDSYNRRLKTITERVRSGDKDAPLELIRTMTEREQKLYELGWIIGGEDGYPKLVPILKNVETSPDDIS